MIDNLAFPRAKRIDHATNSPAGSMHFTHAPGSSPLDRYTIRRGLGVGGFGEVYFAVSEGGKEVALKQIQRNWDVELRGARHCLNLKHPNLVSLHDVTRDDRDQWWIVMEYIAGPNLRDVLNRNPDGLDQPEVQRWLAGVCRGVAHLHAAGLVHRDLKPGNLFDDEGVIKVGDYGLSKFVSHTVRGGHTESVGTFHYMAPEVGRGEYGPGVDVYAIGIIAYELLTGEVPFDGQSQHEIIIKHLSDRPDLSRIDSRYRGIIDRCLRKDPADRFADAGQLASAIESAGQPADRPVSPGQRLVSDNRPTFAPEADGEFHGTGRRGNHLAGPSDRSGATARSPNEQPVIGIGGLLHHGMAEVTEWARSLSRPSWIWLAVTVTALSVARVRVPWSLWLVVGLLGLLVAGGRRARRNQLESVRRGNRDRQLVSQTVAPEPVRRPEPPWQPEQPVRRQITRSHWRSIMRQQLRSNRGLSGAAQYCGSVVVAGLVCGVATALASLLSGRDVHGDSLGVTPFVAAWVVATVASAGLLLLGRFWQTSEGSSLPRRMVTAGLGGATGLVAAGVMDFLMMTGDGRLIRDIDATGLPAGLYDAAGHPSGAAVVAYFALLFALLRTWRVVDPLRRRRVSLWAVAVSVVAAWLVHQFVPIHQPFGMLVAGVTAIATQIAAPWVHPQTPPPGDSDVLVTTDPMVRQPRVI